MGETLSIVKDEKELSMLAHVKGAEEPPNYHTVNLIAVDHHGDLMDRSGIR